MSQSCVHPGRLTTDGWRGCCGLLAIFGGSLESMQILVRHLMYIQLCFTPLTFKLFGHMLKKQPWENSMLILKHMGHCLLNNDSKISAMETSFSWFSFAISQNVLGLSQWVLYYFKDFFLNYLWHPSCCTASKASAWDISIPFGCWFQTCPTFDPPLCYCLRKQQRMTQALGTLHPHRRPARTPDFSQF